MHLKMYILTLKMYEYESIFKPFKTSLIIMTYCNQSCDCDASDRPQVSGPPSHVTVMVHAGPSPSLSRAAR